MSKQEAEIEVFEAIPGIYENSAFIGINHDLVRLMAHAEQQRQQRRGRSVCVFDVDTIMSERFNVDWWAVEPEDIGTTLQAAEVLSVEWIFLAVQDRIAESKEAPPVAIIAGHPSVMFNKQALKLMSRAAMICSIFGPKDQGAESCDTEAGMRFQRNVASTSMSQTELRTYSRKPSSNAFNRIYRQHPFLADVVFDMLSDDSYQNEQLAERYVVARSMQLSGRSFF